MKLMTLKQYMKMSKKALIRKITKTLRAMPKKKLAIACYNITKSTLPKLTYEQTKMKMLGKYKKLKFTEEIPKRKTTKRKTKKIVGKIYHTKNGQPYKILASGKARFVKK